VKTIPQRFARASFIALGLCAGSVACIDISKASDSSAGVPLPGLVSVPAHGAAVKESDLELRGDDVSLRLVIQQTGRDATLLIRGPQFGWLGEAEPYPDRNFPELRATLNGADAGTSTFRAFIADLEISGDLLESGLDPFAIAATPPFVAPPEGEARRAFDRLAAERAVELENGQYWARWTAQKLFTIPLGENISSAVLLVYRARPGFLLLGWADLERLIPLSAYCLTPSALQQELKANGQDLPQFVARTYNISVGVDHKAPATTSARVADKNAVFCGADGGPVFGGPNQPRAIPRANDGIVRILRIDPPG
jgi:hypothetical protein